MYFVTTDQIHFYSSIKSEICNIQELIITNAVQNKNASAAACLFFVDAKW